MAGHVAEELLSPTMVPTNSAPRPCNTPIQDPFCFWQQTMCYPTPLPLKHYGGKRKFSWKHLYICTMSHSQIQVLPDITLFLFCTSWIAEGSISPRGGQPWLWKDPESNCAVHLFGHWDIRISLYISFQLTLCSDGIACPWRMWFITTKSRASCRMSLDLPAHAGPTW